MKAKYSKGAKVRIKSQNYYGRALDPKVLPYHNQVGEIVNVVTVTGFVLSQTWAENPEGSQRPLYYYEVRLEDKTILENVIEDSLELMVQSPPVLP